MLKWLKKANLTLQQFRALGPGLPDPNQQATDDAALRASKDRGRKINTKNFIFLIIYPILVKPSQVMHYQKILKILAYGY